VTDGKIEPVFISRVALVVIRSLVGGQNGQKNCWTKILAETLTPLLLLGVDL
jgi:hypothetical protein